MVKKFSRVILKDPDGDILVLRDRVENWNFPGGKEDEGENAEICAIREVKEEVDLDVSELEEIYKGKFVFGENDWIGTFYFAHKASGVARLNEPKIKGVQYVEDLSYVNFTKELDPMFEHLADNGILENRITKWD